MQVQICSSMVAQEKEAARSDASAKVPDTEHSTDITDS